MYMETIPWEVNYDETEIPPYTIPEVLRCQDGTLVGTAAEWKNRRRPELLRLFRDVMYGAVPSVPDRIGWELLSEKRGAENGRAVRREIRMRLEMNGGRAHEVDILLYIPAESSEKAPVFVGLTFGGNHSVTTEHDVRETGLSGRSDGDKTFVRGAHARRFPLERILDRGYAIAVASYHDFFPDTPHGWEKSVYSLFFTGEQLGRRPKGCSSIAAWSWGLSRLLDCLETVPGIDGTRAAVFGHSRLGKASLWAGAQDERFKLVCVNDSGCGGAALSRRLYGETLFSMYHHNAVGEYWFTDTLKARAAAPQDLPVEQHELLALVAPRRLAVHSATEDRWADPKSEYLSAFHAGEVYRLFGRDSLASGEPPLPGEGAGTDVSYYCRAGGHDLLEPDWIHYLNMADRALRPEKKESALKDSEIKK